MKIALTVWEDRISPVFDAASTLLVVELFDGGVFETRLASLQPTGAMRLAETLKQMDVSVFICGAITEGYANRLASGGIELISFVSGKTENILDALANGESIVPAFLMPGCKNQYRRQTFIPSQNVNQKEVMTMPNKDKTGPAGQGPGSGRRKGRCKSGPETGSSPGNRNSGRGGKNQGGTGQRRRQSKY